MRTLSIVPAFVILPVVILAASGAALAQAGTGGSAGGPSMANCPAGSAGNDPACLNRSRLGTSGSTWGTGGSAGSAASGSTWEQRGQTGQGGAAAAGSGTSGSIATPDAGSIGGGSIGGGMGSATPQADQSKK